MAKKKIELFIEIHNEKELDNVIKNSTDQLICAEIYSYAFGWCTALDRLFNTIKLDWSGGKLILLKVPADEIEALRRFRDQSQPVYTFILNNKVTKVFRGVDAVKFAEVARSELHYYNQELNGFGSERQTYELDEPTPDELERDEQIAEIEKDIIIHSVPLITTHTLLLNSVDWMSVRQLEVQQDTTSLADRRAARQAIRKRHRAELMVPHLTDINFVLFWPHCVHAHPELYEKWDANSWHTTTLCKIHITQLQDQWFRNLNHHGMVLVNIVMVGREEFELTEEKITDIFYAGDAPLNEASRHKLMSAPALAICFRLLDTDVDFPYSFQYTALVRRILYEEIPQFDERKSIDDQVPLKTAFDRYKTFSPTREEIWQQRRIDWELEKAEEKKKRARYLSETRRLKQQALEEAIEAKKRQKEQRKLELLRAGNLMALDKIAEESEDEAPETMEPEELEEEEDESMEEPDENEYFPPPGLLVPGFYAPPNDIAKSNGLAVLFPKLVSERVTPQAEFLPRHVLVLLEIGKRYKAIEAIAPFKRYIIHMGIFDAQTPYSSVHIAHTVKQFDTLDSDSMNHEQLKLAFMLSVEVDVPLLHLMDLNPVHVSRDCSSGEEECAAMFPVDYGDDCDQYEDFH